MEFAVLLRITNCLASFGLINIFSNKHGIANEENIARKSF